MASGEGYHLIPQPYRTVNGQRRVVIRQVFDEHYLNWSMCTPTTMFQTALVSGMSWNDIVIFVLANEGLIQTGWVAALETNQTYVLQELVNMLFVWRLYQEEIRVVGIFNCVLGLYHIQHDLDWRKGSVVVSYLGPLTEFNIAGQRPDSNIIVFIPCMKWSSWLEV